MYNNCKDSIGKVRSSEKKDKHEVCWQGIWLLTIWGCGK